MTGMEQSPCNDGLTPPVIILVRPQLGENIGASARAMMNCGLTELRLVSPRDGWPNYRAVATASGANSILEKAQLFATTHDAVADLHHLWATTARSRDMRKPETSPRGAVLRMRRAAAMEERCGILFGAERTGLTNDELNLADFILQFPLNPDFSSLNLAQAVLLVSYQWRDATQEDRQESVPESEQGHRPATRKQIHHFFRHLEQELERHGFFRHEHMRPTMVKNIRNLFLRSGLRDQEVRTLHGMIASLSGYRLDGTPCRFPPPQDTKENSKDD